MINIVDVIAVEIKAPHAERVMERNLSPQDAEAYVKTAIMRRGVDTEFYTIRPVTFDLAAIRKFIESFIADSDPPSLMTPNDVDANEFAQMWDAASKALAALSAADGSKK